MRNYKEKAKDFAKENNVSEGQVLFLLTLCGNNFETLKSVVDYYKAMVVPPPADVETFNQYLVESIVWRMCQKLGLDYHYPYIKGEKVAYKVVDEKHKQNMLNYKKVMRQK